MVRFIEKSPEKTLQVKQTEDPTTRPCILCGSAVQKMHCKRICRDCGYIEDCSDLVYN